MAAIKYTENLSLLRSIQKELKSAIKNGQSRDHYKYFAETYLTYLRSSRLEEELVNKYFNKGERSIKESARLVGLELPKHNNS